MLLFRRKPDDTEITEPTIEIEFITTGYLDDDIPFVLYSRQEYGLKEYLDHIYKVRPPKGNHISKNARRRMKKRQRKGGRCQYETPLWDKDEETEGLHGYTGLSLGIVALLCFFLMLIMIPVANGHLQDKYAGYEVIHRPEVVESNRRIILLKDIYLKRGLLVSFHAICEPSMDVRTYFQIWRRLWAPGSREKHILIAQQLCTNMVYNYTLDVEDQNIRVEEGDRLGLMVPSDDFVPILASHTPAMTSTIFHNLGDGDPPRVNDTTGIYFDELEFPYTFSAGVTYEPDEHTEGVYVGETGATGATGPMGPSGEDGATGHTGPAGPPGLNGLKGDRGSPGTHGIPGPAGPSGTIGSTGAIGPIGATGAPGPQGETGEKGDKGEEGLVGATGATGHTGRQGATGEIGATGEPGRIGGTGATGSTGSTGATGPHGAIGATGPIGNPGLKGDRGQRGEPGEPGLQGMPGVPGKDMSFSFNDTCTSAEMKCAHSCEVDILTEQRYRCTCDKGWELAEDGYSCLDINECLVNNGNCQSICMNEIGSYGCACSVGLKLAPEKHTCIDVSECDVNNGECADAETCLDLYGGHVCIRKIPEDAPAGYIVTGSKVESARRADNEEDDKEKLVMDEIIIGLIIWLVVITVIVVVILIVLGMQRRKRHHERKMYMHYARSMRESRSPEPMPAPSTSHYGSDLPDRSSIQY